MSSSKDEREAAELFAERYRRPASDATRELELHVIGSDFGANGYTTLAQADLLAERLELGPGKRLLDVGAGRGWPGLYLAKSTGCSVTVTDLPLEAMRTAARRAASEELSTRVRAVMASARHLPFAPATHDAAVHTDVLCWLTAKLSVLRACRRILRPRGRTAFFTIFVTPGLSKRDHRRAVRLGPRAVASNRGQSELLAAAGFEDIDEIDVTGEFLETTRRWLRYSVRLEPALREALGDEIFDEQAAARRDTAKAIEEGLLRRSLLVAAVPS